MPEPRVTVVRKARYKHLVLRYRDPVTKTEQIRVTETNVVREAEREAAKWEAELASNPNKAPADISWHDFQDLYRDGHLMSLAVRTRELSLNVLDRFAELAKPRRLRDVSAQTISRYAEFRRSSAVAESTIQSELGHIRAALNWARDNEMIREAPHFPRLRRAKSGKRKPMKGRPITEAEYRKMLETVSDVVKDPASAAAWSRYLTGLWVSGLRLEESLDLSWDDDRYLRIDLTHSRPMLRVPAEAEKGNEDRYLPVAPEFAEFLLQSPPELRTGRVFTFPRKRNRGPRISRWRASEMVSDIGRAAGIVVDSRGPKYASAHDFRRAFGTRWAQLVTPQVLMQLMRHDSIETTMRFYVSIQAETTTEILYAAIQKGDKSGDNPKQTKRKRKKQA